MCRFVVFGAVVFILVGSGCRQSAPARPDVNVEALPVIQAKTGGELVLLPAGSFTMGDSAGREDETPHAVWASSFYLDKLPVTQELYTKVMGVNPSKRKDP